MGWKAVKEHYRIGHIVHVHEGQLCIGSPYCWKIIAVSPDGQIGPRDIGLSNEDLKRYVHEIEADPALFSRLFAAEDTFTASLPVWWFDGTSIIETWCEQYGWPNVTHDGLVMYENTFFKSRNAAVDYAIKDMGLAIKYANQSIEEQESKLTESRQKLENYKAVHDRLTSARE